MLSQFGGALSLSLVLGAILGLLAFLGIQLRRPCLTLGRRQALLLLSGWCLVITVEYWILGPYSFDILNDEGEFALPLAIYVATWYRNGTFAHEIMGGIDAGLLYGTQYFCLERLLFTALPSWAALGLHKLLVAAASVSGGYVVARRMGGADRAFAVGVAMFVALAHRYTLTVTLHHGLGYALLPWAVYVIGGRIGRPHYWSAVTGLALLHAASFSPTHSIFSMAGVTVALCWLYPRHLLRICLGSLLVALVAVANWHESLYALMVNGRDSFRALTYPQAEPFLTTLTIPLVNRMGLLVGLLGIGLAALAIRRDRRLGRAAGLMLVCCAAGPALLYVPWERLGVAQLRSIDFTYLTLALVAFAPLILGWASDAVAGFDRLRHAGIALMIASAIGAMGWHKVWHGIQWLGMGGQSVLAVYQNLHQRDWAPSEPFRVVSLPYRLEPNIVAAYGLDTFDGLVNVVPIDRTRFWRNAFVDPGPGLLVGYNYIAHHSSLDFLCCRSYPIDRIVDLDMLRLANVGFVLSLLPLTGDGLSLVSGPPEGTVPPRSDQPLLAKAGGFLRILTERRNVYVYRIDGALPRAHFAAQVSIRDAESGPAAQGRVARAALSGAALLPADQVQPFRAASGAKVDAVVKVPDGYRIDVTAPNGGLLLVNQLWRPGWTVTIDGRPHRPAVPANDLESAIDVPAGTRQVEFLYRPARLKDVLLGRLID